jgi:hypothetical protein
MEHMPLPGKLNESVTVNDKFKRKKDVVMAIPRRQNSDRRPGLQTDLYVDRSDALISYFNMPLK